MSPAAANVTKGNGLALNATVPRATTGSYVFHWEITGDIAANLGDGAGKVGYAFDTASDIVNLVTLPTTNGPLTITVELFEVIGGVRTSLGKAQSQVTMTTASVVISPASALIDLVGGTQVFTLISTPPLAPPANAGPLRYEWSCSSAFGTLTSAGVSTSPAQQIIQTTAATASYAGNSGLAGGESDAISCTVFYFEKPDPVTGASNRVDIAKADAEVNIKQKFNITVSPKVSDVPTDTDFVITALFPETLPAGTKVTWSWLSSGVGSFAPTGGDTDQPKSTGTLSSGSAEGGAFMIVSASVTLVSGLTIPVLPVTIVLHVKKGLKQIVMEVSGGVFACTDPKACGVSAYTAFLVPNLPKATNYSALLSGYDFPSCNRTATWQNKPVEDGGGCAFPVTYHPHSSAGATNLWAVWIGFGGPFSGRCVVTIDLAP